jgi:uncharacterized membrane-anchored protein
MNIDEILKTDANETDMLGMVLSNNITTGFGGNCYINVGKSDDLIADLIKWKDREVYKALRRNDDLTTAIRNKITEKVGET